MQEDVLWTHRAPQQREMAMALIVVRRINRKCQIKCLLSPPIARCFAERFFQKKKKKRPAKVFFGGFFKFISFPVFPLT